MFAFRPLRFSAAVLSAVALAVPALGEDFERFSVEVTGEGADVILVPGLASSAAVWDATVEQLAATHRVHVVQVAGFAGAPAGANAEGPVLDPLADEIADYAAGLDAPAIIGHSLGGLIALEVAAARPEAVGRVMVVDALPFYPLIFNPGATAELVEPQAAMMRDQMIAMDDEQFELSQSMGLSRMAKAEAHQPEILAWSVQSDRRVLAQAMYDDMTIDARPRLAEITAPVTVLYAYDPAMGAPASRVEQLYASAYEGLDGVELTRIEESFHFIMFDQPEAFAEAVVQFLQ